MKVFNPLEQFRIEEIGVSFSPLTNIGIYMLVPVLAMGIWVLGDRGWLGSRWGVVEEFVVTLVSGMSKGGGEVRTEGGVRGERKEWLGLMVALFVNILITNVLGMIPYSYTPTSHLVWTLYMSMSIMLGVTIIGVVRHGVRFLNLFLPEGTPLWLIPLLVTIEMVSYLSRAFSLGIRLGANMISGHSLLKIMSVMSYKVGVLVPMVLLVPLIGLEVAVGSLQAYLFVVLASTYVDEVS